MQRRAAPLWLGGAALAGWPALGCRNEDAPPARGRHRLAIGLAIASHVHAVAWIAQAEGMFDAEGLDVDVQVLGGSAAAIRTLIAGQIDIALAGGDAVLKATWSGADLAVVGTLVDRFYHRLVARRGIAPGNLRGKKIGLPFLGGPQDMAVTFALRKLGLRRQDVEIVALGKDMNLLAALEKGEVDATTAELPRARLSRMGLEVLADLPAEPARFPYLVVAVRRELTEKSPESVKSALAAICHATKRYRDPANRKTSLEIVARHLRSTDPGISEELYDESGPTLLHAPLVPSREAFETAIDLSERGEAEKRQLERLIMLEPLDALRAEGRCVG